MAIVKFSPEGYLTGKEGKPFYLVGINYVASYVCTNFWEDFRPQHIEEDLSTIASMGLNCVRIPMPWYTMEPKPGVYNEDFLPHFDWFLKRCAERELYVMPWFLVGVATQCYDYPYRNGLSFFGPEMTELAENLMTWFVSRYRDEEQILCWDICDEPEFYGLCGPLPDHAPFDRRIMRRWARDIYRAIKLADPNHIVTLGYGPIATDHNGIHIRDAAQTLDCLVVTAYPNVTDEALDRVRNNFFLPYNIRMHNLGKPVFCCEAPGHSNVAYSEEVLRRYFKVSFYSGLLNRCVGFMPWVYTDFDASLWHQVPLESATLEPLFGVCDTQRRIKPRGQELAAFARFVREQRLTEYQFAASRAAILIAPSYYEENDPVYHKTYVCYVLGQTAIGNLDLVWPDMDLSGYRLLLVPSTRGLTTSQWYRLKRFVEEGGTLFVLYDDRRGLNAYLNGLFGFETHSQEKNYGYGEVYTQSRFGDLTPGTCITVGKGREVLRLNPVRCQTMMTFADGSPALTACTVQKGKAWMACSDFTAGLLMDTPNEDFVRCGVYRLMRAVAMEAGALAPFYAGNFMVEAGYLDGPSDALLILINHNIQQEQADISLPDWAGSVQTLDGTPVEMEDGRIQVSLPPSEALVLRALKGARP